MLDWASDPFSEKMGPEQDPEDQGLRKGDEKLWAYPLKDLEMDKGPGEHEWSRERREGLFSTQMPSLPVQTCPCSPGRPSPSLGSQLLLFP